ncbi:MAG: MTH1187 family thiamine-binding protein [Thermoproteus sp.]|nr:MTH1187 family thiamine-binding protein [Thermoproteus sp.]
MAKMIVSFSVTPLGTGSTHMSAYVRAATEILKELGVKYRTGAGFTDIELDDYAKLAEILKRIEERLGAMGVRRIDFFIKIDRRLDEELTIEGKISKIEK